VVLGHSTDISMSYATSDFVGRFLALLAASLFVVAVERPVMRFRKFYFYNRRDLVLRAQSG